MAGIKYNRAAVLEEVNQQIAECQEKLQKAEEQFKKNFDEWKKTVVKTFKDRVDSWEYDSGSRMDFFSGLGIDPPYLANTSKTAIENRLAQLERTKKRITLQRPKHWK